MKTYKTSTRKQQLYNQIEQNMRKKHNLRYLFTDSLGVHTLPTLVAVAMVDEVKIMYCDSKTKVINPKQMDGKLFEDEPNHLEWYNQSCGTYLQIFKPKIRSSESKLPM